MRRSGGINTNLREKETAEEVGDALVGGSTAMVVLKEGQHLEERKERRPAFCAEKRTTKERKKIGGCVTEFRTWVAMFGIFILSHVIHTGYCV